MHAGSAAAAAQLSRNVLCCSGASPSQLSAALPLPRGARRRVGNPASQPSSTGRPACQALAREKRSKANKTTRISPVRFPPAWIGRQAVPPSVYVWICRPNKKPFRGVCALRRGVRIAVTLPVRTKTHLLAQLNHAQHAVCLLPGCLSRCPPLDRGLDSRCCCCSPDLRHHVQRHRARNSAKCARNRLFFFCRLTAGPSLTQHSGPSESALLGHLCALPSRRASQPAGQGRTGRMIEGEIDGR